MGRRPIGVFDSGVGGLSVVQALWRQLPAEDILYVADTANCPYGPRSIDEIQQLSLGIVRYLLSQGAKAIVVACNTASAAALQLLRDTWPGLPVIGMVPAVKPAAAWSKSRVVGVLATPMTLNGALFSDVVRDYAHGVQVISVVCPGLVELVESGDTRSETALEALRPCLAPMLAGGADALVLGCTHYPFLRAAIDQVSGERLRIFEPSEAVARQTGRVLAAQGLLAADASIGRTRIRSSGCAAALQASAGRLLGCELDVAAVRWRHGTLQDIDGTDGVRSER
ncbi:MAG: glutamate racemase [Anaerolineae bacterium]